MRPAVLRFDEKRKRARCTGWPGPCYQHSLFLYLSVSLSSRGVRKGSGECRWWEDARCIKAGDSCRAAWELVLVRAPASSLAKLTHRPNPSILHPSTFGQQSNIRGRNLLFKPTPQAAALSPQRPLEPGEATRPRNRRRRNPRTTATPTEPRLGETAHRWRGEHARTLARRHQGTLIDVRALRQ